MPTDFFPPVVTLYAIQVVTKISILSPVICNTKDYVERHCLSQLIHLNILIYAINIYMDFICFLSVLGVEHMALNMSGNDSTAEPRVFIIYSASFWSISLHK